MVPTPSLSPLARHRPVGLHVAVRRSRFRQSNPIQHRTIHKNPKMAPASHSISLTTTITLLLCLPRIVNIVTAAAAVASPVTPILTPSSLNATATATTAANNLQCVDSADWATSAFQAYDCYSAIGLFEDYEVYRYVAAFLPRVHVSHPNRPAHPLLSPLPPSHPPPSSLPFPPLYPNPNQPLNHDLRIPRLVHNARVRAVRAEDAAEIHVPQLHDGDRDAGGAAAGGGGAGPAAAAAVAGDGPGGLRPDRGGGVERAGWVFEYCWCWWGRDGGRGGGEC